jgi:hypothetical protein
MINLLQELKRDKKKLAVAGIALVVFLYADFSFVIAGQMKGLNAIKQKIVALRKDIGTLKSDIAYVKKTAGSAAAPVAMKKLLMEKEIPLLMQNISAIANANAIRIMQIDSSRDIAKAGKGGQVARAKKGEQSSKQESAALAGVKFKLDMIASYHRLGNFINELENAQKLCIVDSLSINRSTVDPMKQNISLVIKTYVKK